MAEQPVAKAIGRPTVYTDEIADEVCRRLKETGSLRKVCADPDMPPESTVREWVADDRGGVAARYARAREIGFGRLAEDVLEIADASEGDTYVDEKGATRKNHEVLERSRLRVDTRKWLLARVLPKVYGDKVALTGADGGPLQIQAVRFAEALAAPAVAALPGATVPQLPQPDSEEVEE